MKGRNSPVNKNRKRKERLDRLLVKEEKTSDEEREVKILQDRIMPDEVAAKIRTKQDHTVQGKSRK